MEEEGRGKERTKSRGRKPVMKKEMGRICFKHLHIYKLSKTAIKQIH
jgi:hypothetical protein